MLFEIPGEEFHAFQYAHAWSFVYFLNQQPRYKKGFDRFFKEVVGIDAGPIGGAAAVVGAFLREFGRAVPENFFGLCTGMHGEVMPARNKTSAGGAGPRAEGGALPLTSWLTEVLSAAAGLARQV